MKLEEAISKYLGGMVIEFRRPGDVNWHQLKSSSFGSFGTFLELEFRIKKLPRYQVLYKGVHDNNLGVSSGKYTSQAEFECVAPPSFKFIKLLIEECKDD